MSKRTLAIVGGLWFGLLGGIETASAHITLDSPSGGEVLTARTQFLIAWTILDNKLPGDAFIDLSTDDGVSWARLEGLNSTGVAGQYTYPWIVNNVSSNQCRIKLSLIYPGGKDITWNFNPFTINPVAGSFVAVVDGRIDNDLGFLIESAGNSGDKGIFFLSFTGGTQTLNLPGGVTVQIDPDVLTLVLLSNPLVSIATVDAAGLGPTALFPLPNNGALVGTNLWVTAGLWNDPGGPFLEGTQTLNFQIR